MERLLGDTEVEFLTDELLSIINMLKLALLALENEEDNLVPTALETAFQQIQVLVDEYCIIKGE